MKVKIKRKIIPNKCIMDNQVYKITRLNPEFIIDNFDVIFDKERKKIKSVFLENRQHPNCNPKTNEFCIPNSFKELNFNEDSIIFISGLLECFNLDYSYDIPWSGFDYAPDPCGFSVKLGGING